MPLDALAYASMPNSATSKDDLDYFNSAISYNGYTDSNDNKLKFLDNMLSNTTLKRFSCLGNNYVDVRLPVPPELRKEYDAGKFPDSYIKFNYYDKQIEIDDAYKVDGFTPGSKECDTFYTIYCRNMLNFYKEAVGEGNYNQKEFAKYKPECACYSDLSVLDTIPVGFAPKCLFTGCTDPAAYKDPKSRSGHCDLKLCQSIVSAAGADAGGNIALKADITQNCGSGLSQADRAKLAGVDPGNTDPGNTDPGNTDPGSTDPGNTDPGSTDPDSEESPTEIIDKYTGSTTNTYMIGGGSLVLCCCIIFMIFIMMRWSIKIL